MVLLSICTMRWLLVTGSGSLASRLSRLPPSQPNFARGRAPNSSSTPKSSSHWSSRKLGHHLGSWRPHTRPRSPTCSCNVVDDWVMYLLVVYCHIVFKEFWTNVFLVNLSLCWMFFGELFDIWVEWNKFMSLYSNIITAKYSLEIHINSYPILVYTVFHRIISKSRTVVNIDNLFLFNFLNFEYS